MLAGATFKLYTKEDDANKDINAITITKKADGIYLIKKVRIQKWYPLVKKSIIL